MNTAWFDREIEMLESQYHSGEITSEEYRDRERELLDELRGQAEEAARDAYDDTMWRY